MALWIQITPGSDEPIYLQIVEQVGETIAKGQLAVGDKLPAVRKLASELVINPNTVARAYTILEQTGLVTTKTGSGTFVANPALRKISPAFGARPSMVISRPFNEDFNCLSAPRAQE